MTCERKKKLRAAVREAGRAVGIRERENYSSEVIRRIEDSPKFSRAHVVAAFASLPDEVCTDELLRRWSGQKKILLPSVEYGRMVFREYIGEEDLIRGEYGILAPYMSRIVPPEDIDIMLVPGLAFDLRGNRLGRGKGFYDRYLSMRYAAEIHKMGVCMPHQIVDEVPSEPHDIVMDDVITASITN